MHAVLPCIAALLVSASTPAEPRHDPEPPTGAWDDEPEATQGDAESTAALTLERDGADAVPALVAALRAESPYDAGSVIASDARFVRLTHAERARLLDGLEEGIRWWAPLLNLYPGYGLGSLASRDPRGAWLAAADFAGSTLFFAGVLSAFGTSQPSRSGSVLLGTGAALILGSRVGGVILPFTFSGRRHREAERALRALPPPVTAMPALLPIAPGRGAPGAALGVALRY
ncbi:MULTISPECIES: P13 family porin [Anaeromyxobacter]|uniref:P13 family porin n=1 Tax=Anaeromyxobacter TaxID=161492 RepID=UPI001F5A08B6|nr:MULTISPECIES: P13 family porin [unclassified Anaeromyxobacter]